MRKLIISGLVILSLIMIYYLYYVLFMPTSYTGYEAIAEKKVRMTFLFNSLLNPKYSVSLEEMNSSLFDQHRIYLCTAYFEYPPQKCIIAVGKDGTALKLPEEFNEILYKEKIYVDTEEAFEIAKLYVNYNSPWSMTLWKEGMVFLKSIEDIPNPREENLSRFNNIIMPPEIKKENHKFIVKFYTWESIGGVIREWVFIFDDNEIKKIDTKEIAFNIGAVRYLK